MAHVYDWRCTAGRRFHHRRSEQAFPPPVLETAQIVSQMISKVFSNVMLTIETQEVMAGVGKMQMGVGVRRQSRHQPYSRHDARTQTKTSQPKTSQPS